MTQLLDRGVIEGISKIVSSKGRLLHFPLIHSTNHYFLESDEFLEGPPIFILADSQTEGHGRRGRVWLDQPGSSLLLTVGLFRNSADFITWIPLAVGLALYDVLEEIGVVTDLKWPNDLLFNRKKICGILCESRQQGGSFKIAIGVGMNILFSPDSSGISLIEALKQSSVHLDPKRWRVDFISRVILDIFKWVSLCESNSGVEKIKLEWERKSFLMNRRVRVSSQENPVVVLGLDFEGALKVQAEDGSVLALHSDEVSLWV